MIFEALFDVRDILRKNYTKNHISKNTQKSERDETRSADKAVVEGTEGDSGWRRMILAGEDK